MTFPPKTTKELYETMARGYTSFPYEFWRCNAALWNFPAWRKMINLRGETIPEFTDILKHRKLRDVQSILNQGWLRHLMGKKRNREENTLETE